MSQPVWVRLFLVPQTDQLNSMPPSVVGLLTGETPGNYTLNPMLETTEDQDTFEEVYVPVGINFVNKTYVWRCQVLDHKPDVTSVTENSHRSEEDTGGLG